MSRRLGALVALAGALGCGAVLGVRGPLASSAAPSAACSASHHVEQRFPNGAAWSLCWEIRAQEGLVLHDVTFRSSRTTRGRRVLGRAALAQIFVPYDDGAVQFHDITDFGFGSLLSSVTPAQCDGGRLLPFRQRKGGACVQVVAAPDVRYRADSTQRQGSDLVLWSAAQIGAYSYTVRWALGDDGSITPSVGASGALQRYANTADDASGWPVAERGGRVALSHAHLYYFRLDFDIAGAAGDAVQRIDFARPTPESHVLQRTLTTLDHEAAEEVDAKAFRAWRVLDPRVTNADGHAIGYELDPDGDHVYEGPSDEPWTHDQLYVTALSDCERFATHNDVASGCADAPADVSAFANGEPLAGRDVVVWYGLAFHHLPRDEDAPRMDSHWSQFHILPRDWTSRTPGTAGAG